MESITWPTDLLIEIFSYMKSSYAIFRCVSKSTHKAKISWDGWDALIAQGYSVEITDEEIDRYLNGKLNDFPNLPAAEYLDGTKFWYRNGKRHRANDLPAVEYPSGTKNWYRNGLLHRDNDLPAIEWSNGGKEWYRNGKRHRDNDLPAMESPRGTKLWYRDGALYRTHYLSTVK